ncbi:MAG: CopG family antitoxin [Bacteriovoracaceae bacterium]
MKKKKMPQAKIDKKIAEIFKREDPLDGDLSILLEHGKWKKAKFEIKPKDKTITLRISDNLLQAIKSKAQKEGIDYQKWIRASLEDALDKSA